MIEARSSPPENVLPPPVERYTVLGWMYKNLFSSWFNAVLTFAALGLVYAIAKPVLTWAATQARWAGVLVLTARLAVATAVSNPSARGHLIAVAVVALAGFGLGRLAGKRIQRAVLVLWMGVLAVRIFIVKWVA